MQQQLFETLQLAVGVFFSAALCYRRLSWLACRNTSVSGFNEPQQAGKGQDSCSESDMDSVSSDMDAYSHDGPPGITFNSSMVRRVGHVCL